MKLVPGLNFIIKDLLSVLIFILSDHISNDSLNCANKYNCCLCIFLGKLFILVLKFLIDLSETCIHLLDIFWIKLKPD